MTNEKTTLVKTSPAEFDNFLLTKSLSITNYASVLKYGQRLSTHFINNEAFLWMMTMSTIDPNIKSNEQRYTKQNSMHTNRLRPCRKKKRKASSSAFECRNWYYYRDCCQVYASWVGGTNLVNCGQYQAA